MRRALLLAVLVSLSLPALSAAAAPPVTCVGDGQCLRFLFWFPNNLGNQKWDTLGQDGTTAELLGRLQPSGIQTTFQLPFAVSGAVQFVTWTYNPPPSPIDVVIAGSEDIAAGLSAATIEANLKRVFSYLRAHGGTIIPVVPLPNVLDDWPLTVANLPFINQLDPATLTSAQQQVRQQLRAWILSQPNPVDTNSLASLTDGPPSTPTFKEQDALGQLIATAVTRVDNHAPNHRAVSRGSASHTAQRSRRHRRHTPNRAHPANAHRPHRVRLGCALATGVGGPRHAACGGAVPSNIR